MQLILTVPYIIFAFLKLFWVMRRGLSDATRFEWSENQVCVTSILNDGESNRGLPGWRSTWFPLGYDVKLIIDGWKTATFARSRGSIPGCGSNFSIFFFIPFSASTASKTSTIPLSLHSNFQSLPGITIKLWTPRRFIFPRLASET